VARFTKAVIAARGAVPDADLAAFKEAGFDNGPRWRCSATLPTTLGQPALNPELSA
jgi:hypothetical protein